MAKFCKNCKILNSNPLQKFCSPDCMNALGINYLSKPQKELKRVPCKQISAKRTARFAAGDTELPVFDKVRQYKKKCWVCDCDVTWDETFTFPHILAKGMYPALRLFKQNIGRACSIEHHDILDTLIAYNNKNWVQSKMQLEKEILAGREVSIDKVNLYRFYKKV